MPLGIECLLFTPLFNYSTSSVFTVQYEHEDVCSYLTLRTRKKNTYQVSNKEVFLAPLDIVVAIIIIVMTYTTRILNYACLMTMFSDIIIQMLSRHLSLRVAALLSF